MSSNVYGIQYENTDRNLMGNARYSPRSLLGALQNDKSP